MSSKITIKQALVEQGLACDAAQAEKLVLSRRVLLAGQVVASAGQKVAIDQQLTLVADKKYFSRAGEKLEYALGEFQVDIKNKVCADVGASTGGFTGVLLSSGAQKVYAIDVARGEIAWKLRTDPRVILMERTNARELESLPEKIEFVSMDVSFISVSMILPNVKKWLAQNASVVVLVKPQFEAPRELVEDGGIIRDKNTHLIVLQKFIRDAQSAGFFVNKLCRSPIEGVHGNREFLALLQREGVSVSEELVRGLVEV